MEELIEQHGENNNDADNKEYPQHTRYKIVEIADKRSGIKVHTVYPLYYRKKFRIRPPATTEAI